MLELGKASTKESPAGLGKGEAPVLRDGVVVARLRSARWKEAATAVVGDREWTFARQGRELAGRWAVDPEGTARLHARQASFWKGTWALDLEGTVVEMAVASWWRGTHRYSVDGRQVAESGTVSGWSMRPTLTADDPLTLDQQVFLLWLEMVLQRRAAATAGAAAAGGAVAGGAAG